MSLASLPTELIELIAAQLDLSASRSFRSVCSPLNERSLHPFKERFFRTRSVEWTKASLDKLVEITAHSEFGGALHHLIIDATPRHSISLWQLRRISMAETMFRDDSQVQFKSELQEQYVADEKEAMRLSTFFNETRYDQKCLRKAFDKLRRFESIEFEYEGMDKKHSKFGRRYCESSQHAMSRPFVSTMSAIAASGAQVKTISMRQPKIHGAVSIGRLESLAPALCKFDTVFDNLEVLQLNLRDWRYPDEGFELESTRAPFVIRFLAKTRNVKHLDLSCYSSLEDNLFGEMAQHCRFSRLETCKLSLFRIHNAADLSNFLGHTNSTLHALTLNHVMLRDEDNSWSDLLQQLATSKDALQSLETIELAHLFTKSGSQLLFDTSQEKRRVNLGLKDFAGAWREEILNQVDDFSEGSSGPAWHLGAVSYPFLDLRT